MGSASILPRSAQHHRSSLRPGIGRASFKAEGPAGGLIFQTSLDGTLGMGRWPNSVSGIQYGQSCGRGNGPVGGSWSVIVIASFAQAKSFGPLVLARSACDLLARGDEFRRRGRKLRPGGVRPWPQRGLPHVLRGSFLQPDDERAQLRARPRALAPAGGLCSGLLAQLGEQRGQALW
jgi:hypothetical protein